MFLASKELFVCLCLVPSLLKNFSFLFFCLWRFSFIQVTISNFPEKKLPQLHIVYVSSLFPATDYLSLHTCVCLSAGKLSRNVWVRLWNSNPEQPFEWPCHRTERFKPLCWCCMVHAVSVWPGSRPHTHLLYTLAWIKQYFSWKVGLSKSGWGGVLRSQHQVFLLKRVIISVFKSEWGLLTLLLLSV